MDKTYCYIMFIDTEDNKSGYIFDKIMTYQPNIKIGEKILFDHIKYEVISIDQEFSSFGEHEIKIFLKNLTKE